MPQILDPVPGGEDNHILCSYINATSQIQVARITNIANWYFERVVFPGQRLVFEAVFDGILEIHSGMMASSILSDSIPCERLEIKEGLDIQPKIAVKSAGTNSVAPTASSAKSVARESAGSEFTPAKV